VIAALAVSSAVLLAWAEPAAAPCADVRASALAPVQGSIVALELPGAAASAEARASWGGRSVSFWRDEPSTPPRALIGVDLERAAGPVDVLVHRVGDPPCRVALTVVAGDFPERRLQLARRYVEIAPKDMVRVRRETAMLEAVFKTVSERLWRGAFRLPVEAEPASNFGQRRILNGQRRSPHAGVDFDAKAGAPVSATGRGRVMVAEPLFLSGNTVVLDHGLGLFSFYGHLSAMTVQKGDLVEAGVLIGKVGATGRATGPHLHWTIRLNGARVNPLDLVALKPPS
jgi:peptidase M23-like protein